MTSPSFRAPRFDAPVDLEAHLQLVPKDGSVRGMFVTDLLQLAREAAPERDIAAEVGLGNKRFAPFLEYPFTDHLRLMRRAAEVIHPRLPAGEALRRIGHRAYDTLLGSHAGRVLFGAIGVDVDRVVEFGPKGYRLILSFGRVTAQRVGERHFTYVYEGLPAFLEHYHVGVVEGALLHYGLEPRVQVAMKTLADATFDVSWAPRG